MNELQKLYDVLVREGKYTKSFEEFQNQWNDEQYQSKVYEVVHRDGLYTKDRNSFNQKYVGQPQQQYNKFDYKAVPEQPAPTAERQLMSGLESKIPGFEQKMVQREAKKKAVLQSDLSAQKSLVESTARQQEEASLLASQQYEQDVKKMPFISDGFLKNVYEEVKKEENLPDFVKDQLNSFDAMLISKGEFKDENPLGFSVNRIIAETGVEEAVVPKMNYMFGPLGFKFEEAGVGDYMTVTAPNGESKEISLNNFTFEGNVEETKKLKDFIASNATKIPQIEKYAAQYAGSNAKLKSEKDIDTYSLSIAKDYDSLNKDAAILSKDIASFEANLADLNSTPAELRSTPEYINKKKSIEASLLDINTRRQEIIGRNSQIEANKTNLDKAVGKYSDMKAKQGTWAGATYTWLGETAAGLASSALDILIDFSSVDLTGDVSQQRQAAINKSVSNDIATGIPEQDAKNGGYVVDVAVRLNNYNKQSDNKDKLIPEPKQGQSYKDWYNSLNAEQQAAIRVKVEDDITKRAKQVTISPLRESIKGTITDANTSVEWRQLAEETFWGGAYAGLVKSAPAMAMPGGWAARTAAFFAQSSDAVKEEMDRNPAFAEVPESEKLLVTIPIGIANAVLEEIGLSNLIKNKGLVNSLVLKGLQKAGLNATETTLSKIIKNDVESMVARGALTLAGAGLAEAETGAGQQIAEYAVKDIYNMAKEKEMFDTPDTLKEYVYDVVRSGAQEAVGGFVMGTPSAAAAAYRKQGFKGMTDEQFETFEAIANDENMQSSFIATLKTKVAAGDMTMAEAKEELNDYRNSVGLYRSIPTDLSTEAKKEAMNLVREKQVIEERIKDKDEALVKKQKDRIAEINVQLNTLSDNAIQEQTTSEVPIQSETGVGEEVAGGKPTTEPQVTTEEVKEEEVVTPDVTIAEPVVSDIDTELKTINESIGRVKQDFNQEEDDRALSTLEDKVIEAKKNISKAEDTDAAVNELKKAEKEKSDFEESLAKRKDFNDVDNLIADEIDQSKKDTYEYKDLFEQDPRLAAMQSAKDMIEFAKENPDTEIDIARYENDIKLLEEDIAKFPVKTTEAVPVAEVIPTVEAAPKKRGRKKAAPAPAPAIEVVAPAPVVEPAAAPTPAPAKEAKVDKQWDEEMQSVSMEIDYAQDKIEQIKEEIEIEKGNTKDGIAEIKEKMAKVRESVTNKETRKNLLEELETELEDFKEGQADLIQSYKDDIAQQKADAKKAQKRLDKLTAKKEQATQPEAAPKKRDKILRAELDKRYPLVVEFLKSMGYDLDEITSEDSLNILSAAYGALSKSKVGAEKLLLQITEIENLAEELEQGVKKVSKEEFKKQIAESGDFDKKQLKIFNALIDSLQTELMPEYISEKQAKKLKGGDNFFINSLNQLISKAPQAFIHEVGHFAFYKILSKEDRLNYYRYMIDSNYGKGKPSLASRMAISSDELVGITPEGQRNYVTSNATDNFSEYFAVQFEQWYMSERLFPKEIDTIFSKVGEFFNLLIDKLKSGKYVDQNLSEYFNKISVKTKNQQKKNEKIQEALGIEETMMNELQDLEDFFGIDPAISPMSMRYDTPLQKMALMYNMTETGFFPRNASEPNINKDFFQFGLKAKRASSGSYYLVNINTGKMVKPLQRPKGGIPPQASRMSVTISPEVVNQTAKDLSKQKTIDDETVRGYGSWELGEVKYIDSKRVYNDLPDSAATPIEGDYELKIIPISSTNYFFDTDRKGNPVLSREHWEFDNYDNYQTENLDMIKNGYDTKSRKPIILETTKDGLYSVVDGHHRLTIAKELGRKSILALVRKHDGNEAYSNNISYQSASKSYHKAKADGSNPELVNAVDELLSGTIPTQISPMKVTPISVNTMSMEDVIDTARENGFSDDTIKALLMKRGYAAKDIDSALTFNINFASAYTNNNPRTDSPLPKPFRTIDGGVSNGIKLFFDVRNKLIDFAAKGKTYAEIRAKAIELLEANPIFQGQEDTKQLELIAAFDKTLNITRGKLVSAQIADIRKALKERLVGMKDLKKAQLILRNFIRQSLPAVKVPRVFFNLDGITSPAEGINYFNSLRKQVYDFARTAPDGTVGKKILVKDAEKIKEFTINLLKGTEVYKNQSPEVQADMENAIVNSQYTKGASHTLDIYSQKEVNKLIDIVSQTDAKNFLAQAEKVFDIITEQRAKIKAGLLKDMMTLVNKKAKAAITTTGKRRANGLDAQGQSFYQAIKPIIKAAITNDTDAMIRIATELSDTDAIDDVLAKEAAGEKLTTKEQALLDKALAFDTFGDILNMELEEVQDLLDGLKGVRSASIIRLNEKRAERAAQREAMTEEADNQIRDGYEMLFNTDGTPKDRNQLNQDKAAIWQAFKDRKVWSSLKQWLDRYDFVTSPISDYFRKKLAHLGTISNILDKTGTFFTDNLYRALNRMDESNKTNYLNEMNNLDDMSNSISGITKGYKQIRRMIESVGVVKMVIDGKDVIYNGDQLLRIYALSLNQVQRNKLKNMGFTEDKINDIKKKLGPEAIEFADKLVEYFSNEYFESINDIYALVNDVNLGYVENYFPTQTLAAKVDGKLLEDGDFNGIFNAESSPAFKERTDMSSPVDLSASFTNVVESHFQAMERYKAYAVGVKRLNELFKIPSVNVLLEETGLKSITKNLVNMSVNPNAGVKQTQTKLSAAMNKFSGYALAFKLAQIQKQATAIVAAYEDYQFLKGRKMPALDTAMFIIDVAKAITFARYNFNKFYNLSGNFRDRVNKGVEGDVYGLESGGKIFKPLSQKATRLADVKRFIKSAAASPTMVGDIISVYGYMANYNRDIANGMSPEAALEKFNNYNATLQSRRATDKSTLQFSQNELTRAFTMFGSTGLLQVNKVAMAYKNIMRSIANGKVPLGKDIRAFALNLGVANALFVGASYIFALIKGDDEDKEKVKDKMFEALVGLNLLYQIPLIGGAAEEVANAIKGEKTMGGDVTNPYTSVFRKIKKQYDEDNNVIQNFRPVAEFALGMQFDPFIALYEGATEEFDDEVMYDILGISPSYRPQNASSLENMNKTELKKYNPDEYKRLYGPGSKGYDAEQAEKEAKAAERKARKDAMDDYYNYSSGEGVKRGGSRIGGRGGSRTGGSRTK